jgi:HlyD family secretion protein
MKRSIFRTVALERLSSPEHLDQAYQITTPKEWLALAGVLLLLGSAVAWSFTGSLATKVVAPGVIIRSGGVVNVVAAGSGLVLDTSVNPGDFINAQQVVGRIAQPGLAERIKLTQAILAEARQERTRAFRVRTESSRLQIEALERQRANAEREIEVLQAQSKVVAERVPVDDRLLAEGLITRQQTLIPREKLAQLEGQVASQHAFLKQVEAQEFTISGQPAENDIDLQARIADQERNLAALEKELAAAANVVSPYSGRVVEVKVSRGAAVLAGSPVISIQSDQEKLEALVYLNSTQAKDVRPGMEAEISPGTVRREEYGYMKGKVLFVADYPATQASIMRRLENESLMQSLASSGPVTELRVVLEPADNPSGFRWSSRMGPPIRISSGTLCSAMIVTRRDRPIYLVLPGVKQNLGVE